MTPPDSLPPHPRLDLEQRDFRADPLKLKRLRVAAGLNMKQFAKAADLDRTTASKILRGQPVFLTSLAQAVRRAFQIENVLEVLHPEELVAMGATTEHAGVNHILEWELVRYLSPWQTTPNGLQYQVAHLRHRFLAGREARGKCYELRHLASDARERLTTALHRHVDVCETIGTHPNVAENLTAAMIGGLWWVIDRWVSEETLAERLQSEALGDYELRWIMTGIIRGLAALHRAQVVCRTLSPRTVLLHTSNDRPVIADLDLAKLLEGSITVAPSQWQEDPYRALEVTGATSIDGRADLYSWGRIFVHGALGSLPDQGAEADALKRVDLPDTIRRLVLQCVSVRVSARPGDAHQVVTALERWI